MRNIQEIWNSINEKKREQKQYKNMYKDALDSSHEYQEILEKLKALKDRKKQIENETKNELGNDWDKVDLLSLHIREERETLADVAISTLMKGETVQVEDQDNNPYEPVFSVRFKKANRAEADKATRA